MSGAKEQHKTYLFSLVLTHARYLEKLIPILALNNISGPFKFVYSTFNDQILETEIFENLREPTFSANQACTTLKLDQNTKKYFEELNINIYLKANKCNLEIENDYQDSINIAKASIHVLDIIGNGNYEKGFEITGEFQLNLSPLLYQNEEYELLPKIGLLIKFLPCDSQFLPDINLKGLKDTEKTPITPTQKSILLDENLAIKLERKKKKEAYKELLVNLMKECITKKDAPSDEDNNIYDYKAQIKQQNLKIQDMENKILDLEKDLQTKSLENINLSQKCTQLSKKLEINSNMLLEYKYNSYKNMLLNYFKENMVEDEKKKHLEVFLSDFWDNLSHTKISSKTTSGPINNEKDKLNIINNLIESGIFEPEDNFIHYLQGQHNAS